MDKAIVSKNQPTVYFFSGLGADERAFQRLDLGNAATRYIQWLVPEKAESFAQYAARLMPQITSPEPILVGLSFGGIMALEVAKQLSVKKVILLGSVKNKHEIPPYYRFSARIGLNRFIPVTWLKKTNKLTYWLFGASSLADQRLLQQILHDTDPRFLTWAMHRLALWQNEVIPTEIIHIHGTADHVLPYRFIKNAIPIDQAGHFMTLNRAEEISQLLRRLLH